MAIFRSCGMVCVIIRIASWESLESHPWYRLHEAILMIAHTIPFQEEICQSEYVEIMELLFWGLEKEFKLTMMLEPSVFEPFKIHCS